MTVLWVLWVIYMLAFAADLLYMQPYRTLRAAQRGRAHEAGAISYGLRTALPIFTVAIVARTFIVDVYHVPTASMEPNLSQGSIIWTNRLAYGLRSPLSGEVWLGQGREPQPGEVIVFKYPREPRTVFVKRVLGVPGDHVEVRGDRIAVNGQLVNAGDEDSAGGDSIVQLGRARFAVHDDPELMSDVELDLVVPEAHYFTLGDNLNHSEDSRAWGLVSARHLIGRVWH